MHSMMRSTITLGVCCCADRAGGIDGMEGDAAAALALLLSLTAVDVEEVGGREAEGGALEAGTGLALLGLGVLAIRSLK